MKSQPILRLDKTPATQRPPSADCVDLIYDAESGALKAIDSTGDVPFAGASVTPASLVTAAGQMTASQETEFRAAIRALGYNPESSVVVSPYGTDADRGTALAAAYTAAKLLTPNGDALSANNRAAVIIPPGKYKLNSSLVLDTDFVDLLPLIPEKPPRRRELDQDVTPDGSTINLTYYRPGSTVIYSELEYTSTVIQTCDDLRMVGFTVSNLCIGIGWGSGIEYTKPPWGALLIGEDSVNEPSQYTDMYFWTSCALFSNVGGVRGVFAFSGTWLNCVSNSASFRAGRADIVTPAGIFSAQMFDCDAGPFSYIGDVVGATAVGARFERCKCIGYSPDGDAGKAGFAGCNINGIPLGPTNVFVDCVSGESSFGKGNLIESTFIRCRAGIESFGSMNGSNQLPGIFAGYAEDCFAGADSFGGVPAVSGKGGRCTGTLVRCTVENNTGPIPLKGANIRGCRITVADTGVNALEILDATSAISDTDILVLQGGAGVPIKAATGPITSTANASTFSRVTSANHPLLVGDTVTFAGSTNMNGTYTVTAITETTFTVNHTFASNNTAGTWIAGSSATGSVAAYHCRMNNSSNDADGLHSNVTNLIATPYNVIDNDIA